MVAPFAGAWIEIAITALITLWLQSLPSRERGLKCCYTPASSLACVAPFAGAWIEIPVIPLKWLPFKSRSLRGSVD